MRRQSLRYVLVALVSAAIAVSATLVLVNRDGRDTRVTATGVADNSTSPMVTSTTSTAVGDDKLARPTAVRTPSPVTADGCSGATEAMLHGDVLGVTTGDGVEEVSIDGTRRLRVDGPTGQYPSPSWSADGRFVAFTVGTWQDDPKPSLGVADIKTHCWKVWPRGRDAFSEPSLSNDGSKVVYTVGPNGTTMAADLRAELADADGSHRERFGDFARGGAAWAPDTSGRFAYSDREGLKVRDPSGTATILHQVGDSEFASWSPDATRLAYSVSTNAGVWVANADGTSHRELVKGVASIFFMSWSPDSKNIAYNNTGGLFVVSADGGAPRELPVGTGVDGRPLWSPDGKSILYTAPNGGGPPRVYAVSAEGGNPHLVADNATLTTVFHRD